MAIIPNYILKNIVDLIINHIYKSTNKKIIYREYTPETKNITQNNEIINLSLVSKDWFKFCSDLLSSSLNLNNYYVLKTLINDSTINNNNNSKQFKLLSTDRNQLIKVYNSYKSYYQDSMKVSTEYYQQFRKVYITIFNPDFILINKQLNQYPSNFVFNFDLVISDGDDIISEINKMGKNLTNVNSFSICGWLSGSQEEYDKIMAKFLQLNPKRLYNGLNSFSENGILMKSMNGLKSLKVKHSKTNPRDMIYLDNENSKLKELSFEIEMAAYFGLVEYAQQIVGVDENDSSNDYSIYVKLKKGWDVMIEKLKNNTTIKILDIDFQRMHNKRDFYFIQFANDLASIISSQLSNIKVLYLSNYGPIVKNVAFISALSLNKTIDTLVIKGDTDPKEIFNRVLGVNTSIRNIIFSDLSRYLNYIREYPNFKSIYSITVVIPDSNQLLMLLDDLESLTNPPKEFTIYIYKDPTNRIFFNYPEIYNQTKIINNMMVNIISTLRPSIIF